MSKCPRCHKHRIRTKKTDPHGFTYIPLEVKYCMGCGWEKTIAPKEPYCDYSLPPCPDNCPVCEQQGIQDVQSAQGLQSMQGIQGPEEITVVPKVEPPKPFFIRLIDAMFKERLI